MADQAELKKLVKQLQGTSQESVILSLLTTLKKDFVVNESILRETKAGLAVGKLRTHASKSVADAAKDIVKKWKNDVDKAKAGGATAKKPSTPTTPVAAPPKQAAERSAKKDLGGAKVTHDSTRDKCIDLIYDGICAGSSLPNDKLLSTSSAVEAAVYAAHGRSTSAEYKARIRTLYMNLKAKNNPKLKVAVASGEISAEKFATMSNEEMASEERKAEDKAIRELNLFKSLAAGDQQAETDGFQCGRCKQRKTVYRQAQTRSADEPMTTFVTCTNCGNKWKFS
ncbi:transcription elongation factor [Hymenopellis radicata]|nr:transcription elongation factor [Hymenopellis radicata]